MVSVGEIFKHYKNPSHTYKVIAVAKSSEDLSLWVVYEAQYENLESKVWIRPIENFTEEVLVDGKKVKRFEKI